MMKSKFFKATPGWGTGDIDEIVNEWLHDKTIKIIDIKYSNHTEMFIDCYYKETEGNAFTAMILYEDII